MDDPGVVHGVLDHLLPRVGRPPHPLRIVAGWGADVDGAPEVCDPAQRPAVPAHGAGSAALRHLPRH